MGNSRPVTAVSRNSGTRRIREDTQGYEQGANQVQEDTGRREDTEGHVIAPVRDREAPGLSSNSPWLYIQSEARHGVAANLGPVESVHLKKIRGMRR